MEVIQKPTDDSTQAANSSRRLSGWRRIKALFGGEQVHVNQEMLGHNIGRIALVGEFAFRANAQSQGIIARRVAQILNGNNIIDQETVVDIRTMAPDSLGSRENISLDISADRLAHALQQGYAVDQHIHPEPIQVPTNSLSAMAMHAYAGISSIAPEHTSEAPSRSLVVVTNPEFVTRVFPNLLNHNMVAGGVAVLAEVGNQPEANRFIQLWPAAPSGEYQ